MEKIILMVDTARAAVREAAAQFASMGCQVHVLACEAVDIPGVTVHAANLLDEAAVKAVAESLERIDILILGATPVEEDGPIGTGHDVDQMLEQLTYIGRGTGNVIEAALPRMQQGMKRVACITEKESSIGYSTECGSMTRHMAMVAVNKIGRELFNTLRPEGFTFRWYAEDGTPAPMSAAEYILSKLSFHPDEVTCHNEEDRIVMRDGFLREIPW